MSYPVMCYLLHLLMFGLKLSIMAKANSGNIDKKAHILIC